MDNTKITGLRVFLLTLLHMNANGIKESCTTIESAIADGVATMLFNKYASQFWGNFNSDHLNGIDEYYRNFSGCAEGNEMRQYLCSESDGLVLLIALALNDIY